MLNFMKGSFFSRQDKTEQGEDEQSGGMLAVWGSPGSGKSVTAAKIALHLANRKKNVALLLCDMTAPMLPCICPPTELEAARSLGEVFADAHVSESLVRKSCFTHKHLPHLTILGLCKGENVYTHQDCTETHAAELYNCLRGIAPHVVVDCGSYITSDILSAMALMEADSVLRLTGADLKAISYLSSQLPLLRDAKWDADKQYTVAVKRGRIELELPRFVATIAQSLKASRDVLSMLESYKKHAGEAFAAELDVLTADMRSSSYEAALTRFEARMNSPMLSDVVRGLIGVLRGDDGGVYFQMLTHDMKQLELQRLRGEALKVPPKIRVFSFAMLVCFLMTYLVVIGFEIVRAAGTMF